jgi:hypothetical protein
MATTILEMLGTVRPDGTLELDEKVDVPPGRVRVRVESVASPSPSPDSLLDFINRTRAEMAARGSRFLNDQEVGAWIEELRAEDDRVEEIYKPDSNGRKETSPGC